MDQSTKEADTDTGQTMQRAPSKPLSPAARRALAEAEERRRAAGEQKDPPREIGGRKGPEPVRYGDWEKNGIAWDF